jgi:hypothetical protein
MSAMSAKRPLPGNGKQNGGGYNAGPKKPRGGDSEDEGSSFEDELMMMDEMQVDQSIEIGAGEEQQEARWARPALKFGEDYTAVPLGKYQCL